jgi:hypothetical protein
MRPNELDLYRKSSTIGSFEKKAAANGAPQRLNLATIRLLLFKGLLKFNLPLFLSA